MIHTTPPSRYYRVMQMLYFALFLIASVAFIYVPVHPLAREGGIAFVAFVALIMGEWYGSRAKEATRYGEFSR